ncbi:MAG: hypothetical protein AAF414_24555 [Pseudomonadota bacterium]
MLALTILVALLFLGALTVLPAPQARPVRIRKDEKRPRHRDLNDYS